MKRILHLVPDEKFIDFVITSFNRKTEYINKYCTVLEDNETIKYIKLNEYIEIISKNSLKDRTFLEFLNDFDFIFLHTLNVFNSKLVTTSTSNAIFVWFAWGGDFYNHHPKLKRSLFLPETLKFLRAGNWQSIFKPIFKKLKSFLNYKEPLFLLQNKALKKIKFIAPVIEEDFLIIKKYYSLLPECECLKFTYGNLDSLVPKNIELHGNSIIIGNSATLTNNHLDVIKNISHLNDYIENIILPLNYGDAKYAKHLIHETTLLFKEKLIPLVDFLPIEEYFKILRGSEFLVINSLRQQAMGNLYAFIFYGAKVYLQQSNPMYYFFRKNDIHICTIDELFNAKTLQPLTTEQKAHNNRIIKKMLDPTKIDLDIDVLLNTIKNEY